MARWVPPVHRARPALLGIAVLSCALAAGAVAVEAGGSSAASRTFAVFLLNVALVCSLQVFIGGSGIVSFGHLAFMGVGAYTAALVSIPPPLKATQLPDLPAFVADVELSLVPAVLVATLVTAAIAAVLGGGLTRMTESAMAMGTLALLVVLHTVFLQWETVTRGTLGVFAVPDRVTTWTGLAAAIAFIAFARLFKESGPGLRLRATREDPLSSGAVGIGVVRSRYVAWVVSAAMMGASGSLWALNVLAFDPGQFYFTATFALLAMLVIGGRASVTGAVAGAALVTFITDTLARVEQGVAIGPVELPRLIGTVNFAIALLIIVTLIWRPDGILGRLEIDDLPRRRRHRAAPATGRRIEVEGERDEAETAIGMDGPAEPLGQKAAALAGVDIGKRFQGLRALDAVDLTVAPGEILGLIGPNGSGKTTLLNALSGVSAPDEGRVLLEGRDVTGWPPHRIAELGLARTFQNIRLFAHLTVRENVDAGAPARVTDADVRTLLETFDLADATDSEAASLPYGMQRRLEIARAVVRRPRVLLLDEPAAGMNQAESDHLLANIRRVRAELGCAIVVVDHDLRLIMQLCSRIQVLNQGRTIAIGPPEAIAADPRVIDAYLGTGHHETSIMGDPPATPGPTAASGPTAQGPSA
jgi:branched-chain amino acid transport system permease protein